MCHESNDCEDDKTSEYTGSAVQNTDKHCVSETVVVELAVTGKRNQTSPADPERKENLGRRAFPHHRVG